MNIKLPGVPFFTSESEIVSWETLPRLFDLALLDHGMADVTGLELAQRMRRIRPDFPVVVYTGYFDTPTTEQLNAAGIVGGGVIIKPATLKELADVIKEALGGWQRAGACPETNGGRLHG